MNEPPPSRPGLFSRFREGLRGSSATEKPARTFRFPLHAYGKLPIYKDFIATGLTEPGAREFRSWLDRGFSRRWSLDEGYRSTIIPSHSFLFRLPESKTCVAGTLWGSSDEGGLRKFPFAVFVSFPTGHAAAEPLAALLYLPVLESRAREIRDVFGSEGSLTSFYAKYRGAEVDCPVKPRDRLLFEARQELGAFGMSELGESVMGPEAQDLWPGFVTEVERAVVHGVEGSAGVLRLPIGDGITPARQLKFWMLWLERSAPKRRNSVLGLLYANVSGRAALFFRDLQSEDILLLHPTNDYPGALDPLAAVRRAAPASGEPGEAAAPALSVTPDSSESEAPASSPVLSTSGTEAADPGLVLENAGPSLPTPSDALPSAAPTSEASSSEASPSEAPSPAAAPPPAPALLPAAPELPAPSLAEETGRIPTESTELPAGGASDPQDLPGTGGG